VVRALRHGRVEPLSSADCREIEQKIVSEVLEPERFGDIEFHATRLGRSEVSGHLRLHGRERQLSIAIRRDPGRYVAEVTLHQPDFAIVPYSGFLGSLRVRPDVRVRMSLPYDGEP
jgi:hypothetical protein